MRYEAEKGESIWTFANRMIVEANLACKEITAVFNDYELSVYPNSTEREITYQYEYERLAAKLRKAGIQY